MQKICFKDIIQKILLALLPLAWGVTSWCIWYYGSFLSQNLQLVMLGLVGSLGGYLICGKKFLAKSREPFSLFGYTFYISWWLFPLIMFIGIGATFFFPCQALRLFVQGALLYPIVEELFSRPLFLLNRLSMKEFMFFNVLNSVAFSLMHYFYGETVVQALSAGHFGFSFALNILVYATQRIELTMLIHILSNFLNYTVPVVFFNAPYPSIVFGVTNSLFSIIFYLSFLWAMNKGLRRPFLNKN